MPVVIDIPASLATLLPTIPPWTDIIAYFMPTDEGHAFHLLVLLACVWGCQIMIWKWWTRHIWDRWTRRATLCDAFFLPPGE